MLKQTRFAGNMKPTCRPTNPPPYRRWVSPFRGEGRGGKAIALPDSPRHRGAIPVAPFLGANRKQDRFGRTLTAQQSSLRSLPVVQGGL